MRFSSVSYPSPASLCRPDAARKVLEEKLSDLGLTGEP